MEFAELPEFSRDLKRLKNKYPSLDDDINRLKKVLRELPEGTGGKHWNRIHRSEGVILYKARLACVYLRTDKMRVIYAYHEERPLIVFIELYYKSEQENEDYKRIKRYLSNWGT